MTVKSRGSYFDRPLFKKIYLHVGDTNIKCQRIFSMFVCSQTISESTKKCKNYLKDCDEHARATGGNM